MVLTILLGQVIFPGLCRVVIHSQYLSINGIISWKNRNHLCELLLAATSTEMGLVLKGTDLILGEHRFGVLILRPRLPRQVGQSTKAHFLEIWATKHPRATVTPGGKISVHQDTAKPPKFCPHWSSYITFTDQQQNTFRRSHTWLLIWHFESSSRSLSTACPPTPDKSSPPGWCCTEHLPRCLSQLTCLFPQEVGVPAVVAHVAVEAVVGHEGQTGPRKKQLC